MKAAGTFKPGINAGVAKCTVCGKTRQRANISVENGISTVCTTCYDKAGDENAVADGDLSTVDFHSRYGTHAWSCSFAGCKEA